MTPELYKTIDRQIRKVAHMYCRARSQYNLSFEDMVSDAWVGVLKVLPRFDKKRGIKLASFLGPRIMGAILDGARRSDDLSRIHRQAVTKGQSPAIHTISADVSNFRIRDAAATNRMIAVERRIQFEQMFKKAKALLNATELTVLKRRWFQGWSNIEMASELGVNESRVSQIAQSVIAKIRAANFPGAASVNLDALS